MSFKIIWDKKAYEQFNKLETISAKRIEKKINELAENPYSKEIKRLKGESAFRLRIGDFRVLFDIDKDNITILKVGHRKNIYD